MNWHDVVTVATTGLTTFVFQTLHLRWRVLRDAAREGCAKSTAGAPWKTFDVTSPPENWCLVRFGSGPRDDGMAVLARWSPRAHCWIDHDLNTIAGSYRDVSSYLEMPWETVRETFANLQAVSE